MFLVDKLSHKIAIGAAKAVFGILCVLATLLSCASLLTPAWRSSQMELRANGQQIAYDLRLESGLFWFACNFGAERQNGANLNFHLDGNRICDQWAKVQPVQEHIACALVCASLGAHMLAFACNLFAQRRPLLSPLLPPICALASALLGTALVLFFANCCRDPSPTAIQIDGALLNRTGCSLGYSYTLALLGALASLAAALVGAVIAAKSRANGRRGERKRSSLLQGKRKQKALAK